MFFLKKDSLALHCSVYICCQSLYNHSFFQEGEDIRLFGKLIKNNAEYLPSYSLPLETCLYWDMH